MSNPVGANTVDTDPFPSRPDDAPELHSRVSFVSVVQEDWVVPLSIGWLGGFDGLPQVGRNRHLPRFIAFTEYSNTSVGHRMKDKLSSLSSILRETGNVRRNYGSFHELVEVSMN